MNQLTSDKSTQTPRNKFKKNAAVLTGIIGVGAIMLPLISDAQSRETQCSARLQSGSFTNHITTSNHNTLVNSPSMRLNQYLTVTLPESYTNQIRSIASQRSDGERRAFVADIIQRNIAAAYQSLGSSQQANFNCAPLTEGPASSSVPSAVVDAGAPPRQIPVQSVPSPSSTVVRDAGAIPSSVPTVIAPPPSSTAIPDAGSPPATSPDGGIRRRVIPI